VGLLWLMLSLMCFAPHRCYKFRITVFCPWTNQIEVVEATDPYSRCTTANGERSLLVDLHSPALMPPGWWEHPVPSLAHWTDVSVYELHIRDFR
jgi:1,4-alpha-glucan branching enzyme